MKKNIFLLSLLSLLHIAGQAQKVTFKLVNAASLQPIEGASLKSYLDKNLHLTSDKFGYISVQLKDDDTLTISKDYYHPLYLFTKVKNFDTAHVISINMLPSKDIHEPVKGNFKSLSDFEYHFVHDQLGNESHVNVKGYEHLNASQVRYDMLHTKKNPGGVHITPVLHHQSTGTNQYKLEPDDK
jgi:hypothetical protein